MKQNKLANGITYFTRLNKKGKIIAGVVAVGIVGSLLGFGDNEETSIAQEVNTIETAPATSPVEIEEQTIDYKIEKHYFENDPSYYSGRAVYEVTIFGEFDLESKSLKKDVKKIIKEEAEIALQEQPDSIMVRVAVLQGTKDEHELLPIASRTFDNVEGELEERFLSHKQLFPLLEAMRNQQ